MPPEVGDCTSANVADALPQSAWLATGDATAQARQKLHKLSEEVRRRPVAVQSSVADFLVLELLLHTSGDARRLGGEVTGLEALGNLSGVCTGDELAADEGSNRSSLSASVRTAVAEASRKPLTVNLLFRWTDGVTS
jgi:hypothetical protein